MIRIDNEELGVDYRDSGPWRSYELQTEGNTELELLENAVVFELDQDGGELGDIAYEDCNSEVQAAVERAVKVAILTANIEALI